MSNAAAALISGLRPKQWLKNLLVVAAPLSAGILFEFDVLRIVIFAFSAFCMASSGIYLLNDLLDVEEDRQHPKKKNRPIASGRLPMWLAWTVSAALLVAAPLLSFLLGYVSFALVVVVYEVIQIAYCLWLKHVVVLDIVVVSSGFLIRAIAGATALSIPVSQWFLLVASFGSLFMVAGKRYSEKINHDESSGVTRRNLVRYSLSYLRFVWSLAAGLALISYSLWAFELDVTASVPLAAISIVPFGTALLRYAFSIDTGHAGAPEDTVLGDRQLLVLAVVWLVVFAAAVTVH